MSKEQQRDELHRAIWQIANDLRGSVDGWDFKSYVLGILFYRFISENLTDYINKEEHRTGNKKFDYASITNKEAEFGRADTVKEKGFYILPSDLFVNVCRKAKTDDNLNETLQRVFHRIEHSAKESISTERKFFLQISQLRQCFTLVAIKNRIIKMKRLIFNSIFALLALCTNAQQQTTIKYGDNKEAGGYKEINGIKMYYEIYGGGKPLVLLHGSGGSIRNARPKIDYFKQYFKVIAIDSRAHGKSIDSTTKNLTYEQMAYDIKVLLDSLNIDSAYVSGQSDGGILGLLLAINYPKKISKLAAYGANLFPGKKAIFDEIDNLVLDTLKATKNFNTRRLYSLLAYQPNITEKDLKKIKCPVLIMSGDRDAIRLEHSIKIFNNIPNSNLFVMPGATHSGSIEKPELFNLVLLDFLNRPFSKVSTVDMFTRKH